MRNSKILLLFCTIIIFVGVVTAASIHTATAEEEWTKSFEAFKPTDDPKYHQRNTGGINWGLYQEQTNEEKSWISRLKEAEGQSRLNYLSPANLDEGKYQSPCPLCEGPTYFWLDSGHIDGETVKFIKADYPSWKKEDGICRNCFECYAVRSGKWYDGNLATTTDIYTIGYNKSKRVLGYFEQVK